MPAHASAAASERFHQCQTADLTNENRWELTDDNNRDTTLRSSFHEHLLLEFSRVQDTTALHLHFQAWRSCKSRTGSMRNDDKSTTRFIFQKRAPIAPLHPAPFGISTRPPVHCSDIYIALVWLDCSVQGSFAMLGIRWATTHFPKSIKAGCNVSTRSRSCSRNGVMVLIALSAPKVAEQTAALPRPGRDEAQTTVQR